MASAYEKRGTWYLSYKDEDGRWRTEASAAATKTEARRLAEDLERKAERVRHGLETRKADDKTLGELVSWWLETYCKGKPSYAKTKSSLTCNILGSVLADKIAAKTTPGEIEEFLESKSRELGPKKKPLGPQSLNHLREYLRRTFQAAIKRRFLRENPVLEVKRWTVPKRKHEFLRFDEVLKVLKAIPPNWRSVFATAIYTGLRKGEIFGLRKMDVDFSLRLIYVRCSYERDVTKGGHEEGIPVAAELIPYLVAACEESKSDLVFPAKNGRIQSKNVALQLVLQRALKRAGLVVGYRHKCRKPGCGHVENAAENTIRLCPTHQHKMWVCAVPRRMTFHQLRHTTGSLLTMQGANLSSVQSILRHSDPKTTKERYVHLEPNYLRREVDLLTFQPAAQPEVIEPLSVAASNTGEADLSIGDSFSTRFLPGPSGGELSSELSSENHLTNQPLAFERDIGFEPTTFSLGS